MSVVDVERLLEAIPGVDPCGPLLDGDPSFIEMEKAARGKAEQQFGATVIAAEPPDWKAVGKLSAALLGRTKDLRVGVSLAHALLNTDGFAGLADGLDVVRGLLAKYWDGVHPRLDPDDNDPTWRINSVSSVLGEVTLQGIRRAPLVAVQGLGRFSLREIDIAAGRMGPGPGEAPTPSAAIDAAFSRAAVQELTATAEAIDRAIAAVAAIGDLLTEKVGTREAPDLSELVKALDPARVVLAQRMGISSGAVDDDSASASGRRPGGALSGDIGSIDDIARFIDKACDYLGRYEPSSPVPLLLRRAKRLLGKDFLAVMRDLAPDGLSQVESIRGSEAE